MAVQTSRLRTRARLLASHDGSSLAALLVERAGGTRTSARAAAAKVLRYVFGSDAESAPAWTDEAPGVSVSR